MSESFMFDFALYPSLILYQPYSRDEYKVWNTFIANTGKKQTYFTSAKGNPGFVSIYGDKWKSYDVPLRKQRQSLCFGRKVSRNLCYVLERYQKQEILYPKDGDPEIPMPQDWIDEIKRRKEMGEKWTPSDEKYLGYC